MNKKLIISLAVSFAVVAGVSIPLAIVLPKLIESRKNSGDHVHTYVTKYDKDGHWQECECGDKTEKVAHNMQQDSFTYRTCNAGDQTCYKCTDCDYVICENGKERLSHKFKTTITTEASCAKVGSKHLECELCHSSFDIAYTSSNAHRWDNGTVSEGVTTYMCFDCGKELKLLDHSTSTNATVSASTLADVGTIKLKEASVSFDDSTLSSFGSDVTVSVDKVENAAASYSIVNTQTKELIQDAPVFNFSLKDGEDDVHEFLGTVTVELPYVLSEGEDPDNISIAYVPEGEGEVEYIPASYANGKVTFETTHFSLYAIVRLSAEDCCRKFGHNLIKAKTEPSTCVEHGHEISSCTRCGAQILNELELAEHKYVFNNSVQSTATEHGYIERKCSVCGDIIREELPLIPAGDDSYALTFLRSIVDSNFEANVGMERYEIDDGERIDRYKENIRFVFGINSEHPFMMESEDSGDGDVESVIFTTEGEYSTYNHRHYESNGPVNEAFKAISLFKSKYKCLDKASILVYNALTNVLLTKTTREGFDYYTIDPAKLRAFVQTCKTESSSKIIDKIFGEGFYNELLGIVEKLYNNKVSEVITYLNNIGYPVKEILDLVSIFYYSGEEESLYDRFFTEEVLNMPCKDLIKRYVDLDQYLIPTFEKFKTIVNGFLANSPLDLLVSFVSDDIDFEATAEEYIAYVEKYVSGFELKTTTFGQFVSVKAEVLMPSGHPVGYGDIVYKDDEPEAEHEYDNFRKITVSVNNNIDVAKDYALALEEIAKADKLEKKFANSIVAEKLEKYLESVYGVDFTFYEEDDVRGQAFFESPRSSAMTRELAVLSEEEYARYESVLRVYIGDYYDYYKYNGTKSNFFIYDRFSDTHDVYGKKDSNEVYRAYIYLNPAEIRYDVNNESTQTFQRYNRYGLNCCYDLEKDEYFIAQEQTHHYTYTSISVSEYNNYRKSQYYYEYDYDPEYYENLAKNGAKFYKVTCKDCDYVSYTYSASAYDNYRPWIGDELVLTKDTNEEARKYEIRVNHNYSCYSYYYQYNSYYQYITSISVSKVGSGMSTELSHLTTYGENRFKDVTYTYGNVSIAYTYKNGSSACEKVETITIKIDNKIYDVYVNRVHFASGIHGVDSPTRDDGCYHYWTTNLVCDDCGKTLRTIYHSSDTHTFVTTDTPIKDEGCYHYYHHHVECSTCGYVSSDDDISYSNHNWQKVDTIESGVLFERFDVYKCSNEGCGEYRTENIGWTPSHTTHYQDYEYEPGKWTSLYHCDQCNQDYLMPYHYEFEYMNPDYYSFNFYSSKNTEDYYCVGFRDMTYSYGYDWHSPDSSWICYVGLLPKDEKGQFDILDADEDKYQEISFNNDGYVYHYYDYENYGINRYVEAPFIAFDKDLIDGYLESADENEVLCIFFVHRYYNGIVQVYQFPAINGSLKFNGVLWGFIEKLDS